MLFDFKFTELTGQGCCCFLVEEQWPFSNDVLFSVLFPELSGPGSLAKEQ